MGTQDFNVMGNSSREEAISDASVNTLAKPPQKYVADLKKYEPGAAINNNLVIITITMRRWLLQRHSISR
jgi:hypothetical protein